MLLPDYPLRLRFSFVFCVANATHACPDCCMMCGNSEAVAITAFVVTLLLPLTQLVCKEEPLMFAQLSKPYCVSKASCQSCSRNL